ncbi:MAG: PP2C family protein-serine/threonine phosphatase [Phycisphaerae bacterium]
MPLTSATPTHARKTFQQDVRKPHGFGIRVGVIDGRAGAREQVDRLLSSEAWCACSPAALEGENDFGMLKGFDVMVLVDPLETDEALQQRRQEQLELFHKRRIGALILTTRPWLYAGFDVGVVCLPPDAPPERVRGSLMALAHMRPMIRQVDKQLAAMQRLARSMQKRFAATDHELQLASRLQRDFLPREVPVTGPIRFTTMFRPCSWVSGDIFDIFRLDERHWGFYLADAVGHGVAAGLLTMYIKHAIRPKRILRDGYELVSPADVLSHLNDLLISQGLPESQFITGWYGMVNVETLSLQYAVAGHPPALLIDETGEVRELHGDGCLLGLNTGEPFSNESVVLEPNERVLVYSDGLEPTLIAHRPPLPAKPLFEQGVPELIRLPADLLVDRLRERLDTTPGSLMQADDVSLLMMDVLPDAAATS